MKKSDLKDGMIVKIGKAIYLVCGDKFLGLNGYLGFENYDENLKIKGNEFENLNINFVYETGCWELGLKDLLSETKSLEKIWERPREIDWSKVPFGTKVVASDFEERLHRQYIFVGYKEELKEYPFIVARALDGEAVSFRYCKIHPDVKIQEEWYKE